MGVKSEVAQSCPTLCDPMDYSLPSFSIHGILQARILEWVAMSFSRVSSRPRDQTWVSRIVGRRFNLWATEGGHLFRLTCSVVLWGGRNTANKYHWHVWGVLRVSGSHWVYPSSWQRVLSWSTLLRLQVALQGCCPKQTLHFMHFPGLSCSGSGSWVLRKGTE